MIWFAFQVVEVTGKPYYGYHPREHRFAKIYMYSPWHAKKAAEVLAAGSVMGQVLQPHFGHIPFPLQFMMDYNLQGMSLIHLRHAKFRKKPGQYNDSQISQWPAASQPPSERLFNTNEMPEAMISPDCLPPTTSCDLELDAVASDVMNSNEDLMVSLENLAGKKSGNPGLESIWEDERLRRQRLGIEEPLTPPSSPPRERPK